MEEEKVDFLKLEQALLDLQSRFGAKGNPSIGLFQLKTHFKKNYTSGVEVPSLREMLSGSPMFEVNFGQRTVRFSERHFQDLLGNGMIPDKPRTKGVTRQGKKKVFGGTRRRTLSQPLHLLQKKSSGIKNHSRHQARRSKPLSPLARKKKAPPKPSKKTTIKRDDENPKNLIPMEKRSIVKDIQRIEEFINRIDKVEDKYFNPSKLFRKESFVGLNQKIHNIIFFDSGREKEFKDLSKRKVESIDGIFETVVSDPQKDRILNQFLNEIKRNFNVIDPKHETNRTHLNSIMLETSKLLITEVVEFFGGLDSRELGRKCQETIKSLKTRKNNNLIFLGELKGCGMCRHRSILYKLLCDLIGIPCRILRGWIDLNDKSFAHMWNEIVIGKESSTVDTMNFEEIVPRQISTKHYRNLGHPLSLNKMQRQTLSNIETKYLQNRGNVIGSGAFGIVYEYLDGDVCVSYESPEKFTTKKMDLAVKEVNVTKYDLLSNLDCMKMVRKEIEMMKLFRHPNIVEIIGSFTSRRKPLDELIVHVVMKRYDYCGLKFLQLLSKQKKEHDNDNNMKNISPEKQTTEVLILLIEVAKGLLFIHSFGIIHYDIKLSNILISWDEEENQLTNVVIADFGSTKEEKMNYLITSLPAVTESFAAPEILKQLKNNHQKKKKKKKNEAVKNPYTTKSDIYSYGVLMSKFREFYEEFPRVQEMVKRCMMSSPRDRPSLWEIIYHLRSSLEYKKTVLYQEVIGGSCVPSKITFSSLLFGSSFVSSQQQESSTSTKYGSDDKFNNSVFMEEYDDDDKNIDPFHFVGGKSTYLKRRRNSNVRTMRNLISQNRERNSHRLELLQARNEVENLRREMETKDGMVQEFRKKIKIQNDEIEEMTLKMQQTSSLVINIQKKCKAEELELKQKIRLLEQDLISLQQQQQETSNNNNHNSRVNNNNFPRITINEQDNDDNNNNRSNPNTSTPNVRRRKKSVKRSRSGSRKRRNSFKKKNRGFYRTQGPIFIKSSKSGDNNNDNDDGDGDGSSDDSSISINNRNESSSVLVLDCGSYSCKFGVSGKDSPDVIFPATIYRKKQQHHQKNAINEENIDVGKRYMNDPVIGLIERKEEEEEEEEEGEDDFDPVRNDTSLTCPLSRGGVSNWEDMDILLSYTFSGIESCPKHSILITEPSNNTRNNRMLLTSRVFDKFNFNSFFLCNSAVLSLFAFGRADGVVVESGHSLTSVVPIYGGYSISHGIQTMEMGGKEVNEYLQFLLRQAVTETSNNKLLFSDRVMTDIKEKCCYVSKDYQQEICKDEEIIREENRDQGIDEDFVLPDGTILDLGSVRFSAPEILFDPTMYSSFSSSSPQQQQHGIHKYVRNSIAHCDADLEEMLYQNIVLAGGNTLFVGFRERLEKQIQNDLECSIAPILRTRRISSSNVRIESMVDKDYSFVKCPAWFGASVFVGLPLFSEMSISKDEFGDCGESIVLRKCLM